MESYQDREIVAKVCRSVVSPDYLVNLVSENYDVSGFIKIKLISVGDNDHYLVTSEKDDYVLRVYQQCKPWITSQAQILFELEWLNFLKEKSLPVSYPIKNKTSTFLNTLSAPEGCRYWCLFSVAHGIPMKYSRRKCQDFGRIIANIHLVSNEFCPNYERLNIDINFLIRDPISLIKDNINNKNMKVIDEIAHSTINNILELSAAAKFDEWGIIGGDFHSGNHFHDDNDGLTLFDFDLCGYGWRAYDIAVFYRSLFLTHNPDKEDIKFRILWEAFLEGYCSIRPLQEHEMKAIKSLALARQIWLMGLKNATYPVMPINTAYLEKMEDFLLKLNSYD